MITQTNLNQIVQSLRDFEGRVNALELPTEQELNSATSQFSTIFDEFSQALNGFLGDVEAAAKDFSTKINQPGISADPVDDAIAVETEAAPEAVATLAREEQKTAPIEFKIKYRSTTQHPLSGLDMYSAILIADDEQMFRSGPHYSKADLKDDLNLKMAELNAARSGETRTVSVNYGTELVSVAPDGSRTNLTKQALEELLEGTQQAEGA
jgi:hypothetical protein